MTWILNAATDLDTATDPRSGLGARLGTTAPPRLGTTAPPRLSTTSPPRSERADRAAGAAHGPGHLGQPAPPSGPLLVSSRRWRWRSWLLIAAVVLLEIALLTFAYVIARFAFPQ